MGVSNTCTKFSASVDQQSATDLGGSMPVLNQLSIWLLCACRLLVV